MKARSILMIAGLMIAGTGLFGQKASVSMMNSDTEVLNSLPRLTLPAGYSSMPLPWKKDNTRLMFFSGIYSQEVWNCNQASSIWTMFTYEINWLRNLNSSLPENQYSPMAVYNLLRPNMDNSYPGVSYFDSWNLVKTNGIPGNLDFTAYNQNQQVWMSGYDKYYRGMKNRVDEVYALDVGSPEGLLTLKHWINDHLNGSSVGGLANFQIGSDGMDIPKIPLDKGLEEEDQYIVIKYGPEVGHAMTFAGWNDSVRYDVNGDGRYTNNVDINGDGLVNMKDWEIGAMLVVNSWGTWWGNAGKVWVQYRLLAETLKGGGIWNNAAMVVKPKKTFEPLLTVKANIRYNKRNRIKIQVGIASDLSATQPERVIDFPCFNFLGDDVPMQGFYAVNSDLIEIGLDITPLLNYVPANGQSKIFLQVIEKSRDAEGSGRVESFSVMDYTSGTNEFVSTTGIVPIVRNGMTRLSVPVSSRVSRPYLITEELPDAQVGNEYRFNLEAFGATPPYLFANPATWFDEKPVEPVINFTGGADVITFPEIYDKVKELQFRFPFYGTSYSDITILADGGIIMGHNPVIYPYVVDTCMQFYQNRGIYPFFRTLHYPDHNYKVTFESSSTSAVIRWLATTDPGGLRPVEFAAELKPDGSIGFYYGDMNITPDLDWISGLSKGNNVDVHLMDQNYSGIRKNSAFSLRLVDWPSWLNLDSYGDLYGTPDHSGTFSLPVKVTDGLGVSTSKELLVKVSGGSGVENARLQNGISVFPNPSADGVWFQGFAQRPGSLNIVLYDLTGNRILNEQYTVHAGQVLIPCREFKALPTGIYLYKVNGIIEGSGRIIRQ